MVMEYIHGGDLLDYIIEHQRMPEDQARKFFRQLLSAIRYCHDNHIVHRGNLFKAYILDLKPENLLLDQQGDLKIIDFGFVRSIETISVQLLKTFCGSLYYCAPEMIMGTPYEGKAADIWSLGVVLYVLLNGYLPFREENIVELYEKIQTGHFEDGEYSIAEANELIRQILRPEPENRLSLQEIIYHAWVMEGYDEPVTYSPDTRIRSDAREKIIQDIDRLESDATFESRLKELGIKELNLLLKTNEEIESSIDSGYADSEASDFHSGNSRRISVGDFGFENEMSYVSCPENLKEEKEFDSLDSREYQSDQSTPRSGNVFKRMSQHMAKKNQGSSRKGLSFFFKQK